MAYRTHRAASAALAANHAPNIYADSAALGIMTGDTYVFQVFAVDPDGDALRYFIAGGDDARFFQIDAKFGTVSFKSARDYDAPRDANHDNFYDVVIGVRDHSGATDYMTLTAIVGPEAEIRGTNGYNYLVGTDHGDTIDGRGGSDEIFGGGGNDFIIGGNGADSLTGGAGRDDFVYKAASESSAASGGDTIFDFTPGQDHIDLSRIDADTTIGGYQSFTVLAKDADFTGPGQIAWYHEVINGQVHTILELNLNNNHAPEMVIDLVGNFSNLDQFFVL